VIPAPQSRERGFATSVDGTRIAWRRYGEAGRSIVFVPTWNLVDARVVGYQVAALEPLATVVTYDPRGSGESDRPASGYDFPLHAADALAVIGATGVEDAAVVNASRGLNAAVLLAAEHPQRVTRLAAVAPYMRLEPDPEPPDPARLERWRDDWPGFIVPFMHAVFTEPNSAQLIEEMVDIGLDASPEVVAAQELELDWVTPARLLGHIECPTLIVHGEDDVPVPLETARAVAGELPNTRLVLIPGGGHRPDIRSPELVNPILLEFLLEK